MLFKSAPKLHLDLEKLQNQQNKWNRETRFWGAFTSDSPNGESYSGGSDANQAGVLDSHDLTETKEMIIETSTKSSEIRRRQFASSSGTLCVFVCVGCRNDPILAIGTELCKMKFRFTLCCPPLMNDLDAGSLQDVFGMTKQDPVSTRELCRESIRDPPEVLSVPDSIRHSITSQVFFTSQNALPRVTRHLIRTYGASLHPLITHPKRSRHGISHLTASRLLGVQYTQVWSADHDFFLLLVHLLSFWCRKHFTPNQEREHRVCFIQIMVCFTQMVWFFLFFRACVKQSCAHVPGWAWFVRAIVASRLSEYFLCKLPLHNYLFFLASIAGTSVICVKKYCAFWGFTNITNWHAVASIPVGWIAESWCWRFPKQRLRKGSNTHPRQTPEQKSGGGIFVNCWTPKNSNLVPAKRDKVWIYHPFKRWTKQKSWKAFLTKCFENCMQPTCVVLMGIGFVHSLLEKTASPGPKNIQKCWLFHHSVFLYKTIHFQQSILPIVPSRWATPQSKLPHQQIRSEFDGEFVAYFYNVQMKNIFEREILGHLEWIQTLGNTNVQH